MYRLVAVIGLAATITSAGLSAPVAAPKKPCVVVTTPSLYCWTAAVLGNRGRLGREMELVWLGQPGAKDRLADRKPLLVLAIGLGVDDHVKAPGARRVRLGDALPEKLKITDNGKIVTHVWLGTEQARHMVGRIRDELARADPDGAAHYQRNAARYSVELKELGLLMGVLTSRERRRRDKGPLCLVNPDGCLHYFASSCRVALAKSPGGASADLDGALVDRLETADWAALQKLGSRWYKEKMRQSVRALSRNAPAPRK
jgi:hypothetical protein